MDRGYMLAHLQLKYGQLGRFNEIMAHLVPTLEKKGWRLQGAYRTEIGNLWEVWDLWDVPGASSVSSVLSEASREPEFREWAARLPECVEHEEMHYLVKLPYSPD